MNRIMSNFEIQINVLKEENSQYKEQMGEINLENVKLKSELEDLKNELKANEQCVANLRSRLRQLENEKVEIKSKIERESSEKQLYQALVDQRECEINNLTTLLGTFTQTSTKSQVPIDNVFKNKDQHFMEKLFLRFKESRGKINTKKQKLSGNLTKATNKIKRLVM
jgi:chromosome segregation ATPase